MIIGSCFCPCRWTPLRDDTPLLSFRWQGFDHGFARCRFGVHRRHAPGSLAGGLLPWMAIAFNGGASIWTDSSELVQENGPIGQSSQALSLPEQKCNPEHNSRKRHLRFYDSRDSDNEEHGLRWVPEKGAEVATFASLLRRCTKEKALADGKRVHAYISRCGYDCNTYVGNCLVLLYGSCGSMHDARTTFDKISCPNSFSWSILIKAYAENGNLNGARNIFRKIPQRDVVSWNTMIAACAQHRRAKEALNLFREMQLEGVEPNNVTFLCTLEACGSLETVECQELLTAIDQSRYREDTVVGTALVNMYGKCGRLDNAWRVFERLPERDVVSWNSMIAAFAQNGHGVESLNMFRQMQLEGLKPSRVSFVCILDACAGMTALEEGYEIHAACVDNGYEGDLVVGNALINMYGKSGSLLDARGVFGRMPCHNVVTWTAMTVSCVQENQCEEAIDVFRQMHRQGIKPNEVTLISALEACASLAALEEGLEIHAAIADSAYDVDLLVGTALIHMYGKCGHFLDARNVFERMPQQDLVSWNAMLTACAQNGHGKEVLDLFSRMKLGVKPNYVTFVCVLTACSHMGWVDYGRHYFLSVNRDYGTPPTVEHFFCMVDLLSRAGCLDEAEDLINSMPYEKVASAWTSLLAACKIHGDGLRGLRAAGQYVELNPSNAAPYVMLSNICAMGNGQWGLRAAD